MQVEKRYQGNILRQIIYSITKTPTGRIPVHIMKTVKVTKKNATRMINKLESQLRERLSIFTYYAVSKDEVVGAYARFNVFSTDVSPFITSTAINTVVEVFENSTIDKECKFYGIESCINPNTEREVPCISITIKIEL